MNTDVLLVRPFGVGKKELPLGLLYIGTALQRHGYRAEIVDLQDMPEREAGLISLLKGRPDTVLGISALAPHYRWVKDFTLRVKASQPACKIIVGGHISCLYEMLLTRTGVDFVCLGEGEDVLPELLGALSSNNPLQNITGLAFMDGDSVVKTARRAPLTHFTIPDYGLISTERYFIHPRSDLFFRRSARYHARSSEKDRLSVIMFSRGCVGACGFCYRHVPGFRQAEIDMCMEHLSLLYSRYGVRYFRIDDELFTNNPDWFHAFFAELNRSGMDILFRITGIRTDSVTEDQLYTLKESGCIAVNYGIESGSQKILSAMKKGTTVEQNRLALQKTLQLGMQTMAYIIIGYTGETTQTLMETARLLVSCRIPPEYVSVFYAVPLPGTKLYRNCLAQGLITDEEGYLLGLASYIEKDLKGWEHYRINLSETSISNLRKWEYAMILLLHVNGLFPRGQTVIAGILPWIRLLPTFIVRSRFAGVAVRKTVKMLRAVLHTEDPVKS